MQTLENSGLKVAEENLMYHIRDGKNTILQNRESILNGTYKAKDKHEILLERLSTIKIDTSINEDEIKIFLKKSIAELENAIQNNMLEDNEYLRETILKIETIKCNLKYILDDYQELLKYEEKLTQLKYHLSLKLITNIEDNINKKHTYNI